MTQGLWELMARADLGPGVSDQEVQEFVASHPLVADEVDLRDTKPHLMFDIDTVLPGTFKTGHSRLFRKNERLDATAIARSEENGKESGVETTDLIVTPSIPGGNITAPFSYTPLDSSRQEIRLISISRPEPCDSEGHLRINLAHFPLDKAPSYLALSYAWGENSPTHQISCNGQRLMITESLDLALRRVFTWREAVYLRADGICINQQDVDERNSQVQLMGEIYRTAELTAAYLGEHLASDNTTGGIESEEAAFALIMMLNRIWRQDREDEGPVRTEKQWKELLVPSEAPNWQSLLWLLQQPWFTRSWVLQEVALAKQVVVLCGNAVNTLECLEEFWYHATRRDLPSPLRHGLFPEWKISVEMTNQLTVFRDLRNHRSGKPRSYYCGYFSSGETDDGPGFVCNRASSENTLLSLLVKNQQAYASDDRDKVYSLLSLASDFETHGVQPDYSPDNTAVNVYRDVARKYVNSGQGIKILRHAGLPQRLDLPSWIPDWSMKWRVPLDDNIYQSTKSTQPRIRLDPDDTFTVQGAIIDGVQTTLMQVSSKNQQSPDTSSSIQGENDPGTFSHSGCPKMIQNCLHSDPCGIAITCSKPSSLAPR